MTKLERNVQYLISKGWTELPRLTRYRVFQPSSGELDRRVFLGRNGAVRQGRTVSKSIPVRLRIEEESKA